MLYTLEDLLKVRVFKVEDARRHMETINSQVDFARNDLQRAERALTEFRATRVETEAKLYKQIINTEAKLRDINRLREELRNLQQTNVLKERDVLSAEGALQDRLADLDAATQTYNRLSVQLEKISEHKQLWSQEWLKEEERLQEAEQDETGPKRQFDPQALLSAE
jgi:chromosome segregation ATPase